MVWEAITLNSVGSIHRIQCVINQHVYINILKNMLLGYGANDLSADWIFQADNDSKHTSRKIKKMSTRRQCQGYKIAG